MHLLSKPTETNAHPLPLTSKKWDDVPGPVDVFHNWKCDWYHCEEAQHFPRPARWGSLDFVKGAAPPFLRSSFFPSFLPSVLVPGCPHCGHQGARMSQQACSRSSWRALVLSGHARVRTLSRARAQSVHVRICQIECQIKCKIECGDMCTYKSMCIYIYITVNRIECQMNVRMYAK